MATNTGFKQQCPHCEARIPIKDESQIGEEIKCPKCKQPFVVEDPDDAQSTQAENKRRPAKTKTGKKKDEGDEEGQASKDKKKSKLILGLALAGVAVVLLGVAAFFMMGGSDNKPASSGGAPSPGGAPAAPPTRQLAEAAKPVVASASSPTSANLTNPANLLPNDTEVVFNIQMQEMLKNRFGKMVFDSAGVSQTHSFKGRYGVPVEEIERVLVAGNATDDWLFILLRTNKALKPEAVKKALRLHDSELPIQGQEYFVSSYNWLEAGSPLRIGDKSESSSTPAAPGARPLAVRLVDAQTLVLADLTPMKNFLAVKGQPATMKAAAPPPAQAPADGGGGRRSRGGNQQRSSPTDTTAPPAQTFQGGRRQGSGGGGQPPGTPPPPANQPPGAAPAVVSSNSYMTINPRLKAMLDRVEARPPVLFSWAVDAEADKKDSMGLDTLALGAELKTVGMALHMKDDIIGLAGIECRMEDDAKTIQKTLDTDLQTFATLLRAVGLHVEIGGTNRPMVTPGSNTPGGRGAGGGRGPAQGPGMTPPGLGPPGGPPPQGPGGRGQAAPKNTGPTARLNLTQKGANVDLKVELQLDAKVVERIAEQIEPYLVRVQGEVEMATAHPNPNEAALAGRLYRESRQQFPRGTVQRKPSPSRAGRPWPADQRVSWMADLLPFLGYEGVYNRIKPDRSWQDQDNAVPSVSLIPAFLDGKSQQHDWYIRYAGMKYDVGVTHFVGVAGIGLDAAEYSTTDPAVAKKLGIFGYNRATRVSDITDGLSNTIMMLQVPHAYKGPWIAGGGSTIRGVPETRSIQPFVATQHDGKRGTFAMMADGSVRFIAENVTDEVFKALCTIKGGEPKLNLDKVAPVLPPPTEDQPVQKAQLETR